jgi:NADH-quinone oxidoreductase subunit E
MVEKIDKIIRESGFEQRELIQILHRIQSDLGYIPEEAISAMSEHLKVTESEIFGVLTFYKAFSLEPRGKYSVTVCMGTACHVRGGPQIVEEFERKLGLKSGQTSEDKKFTLETVNCLGCCAIGPVVVVNDKYFSNVGIKKIDSILKEYQ